MEQLDIVITNARILTMAPPGFEVIDGGFLSIRNGKIVGLGPARELGKGCYTADGGWRSAPDTCSAKQVIDAGGAIVMPGLIDTHFHTAQQFLRGRLFDLSTRRTLRLPTWKNYLITFEQLLKPEDVYISGLVAYANLIRVGTTCFAEAGGPCPGDMGRAAAETGIRGILALSTMDSGDGVPARMLMSTEEAIERNMELVKNWNGKENGRIRAWLALRQLIVCTPRLWVRFAELAEELDTRIHTHLAEGTYEVDFSLERFGKRPAVHLEALGVLNPRLHCAHSALLSDQEVDLYAKYDVSSAHCPIGNFTLFGRPRVPEMRRRGIRVGIASDGASQGSVDLFRAMVVSLVCQRSHFGAPYRDTNNVTLLDMLRMATIDGARALGLDREIGSLEVGKRADVIILKANDLDVFPAYHPVFVAGNTSGELVDTVIIDGKVVMHGRRLCTVDEEQLLREARSRLEDIMRRYLDVVS
ncbi:MAG: amidohydrolase family protein [Bacteroidota bacterium]